MNDRYFVLKGVAGLGNRIEVFLGAVAFSLASGRKLVVDWSDGLYSVPGENAFTEFFSSPTILAEVRPTLLEGRSIAPRDWAGQLHSSVYQHPLYRAADPRNLDAILRLRELLTIKPPSLLNYDEEVIVYYGYNFEPSLQFLVEHKLLDTPAENIEAAIRSLLRKYLTVRPDIVAVTDALQRKLFTSAHTIAVHVRNTDNQKNERFRIDTSRHLAIVRRLCRKTQNAKIFLATDSRATERAYRDLFQHLCIVPKSYPRDDSQSLHHTHELDKKQSTIDAIIEMLLLGRADTLVHSSRSTFALTGVRLVGNPDVRMIDVESAMSRICVLLGVDEQALKRRFPALPRALASARRRKRQGRDLLRRLVRKARR